jgi:hypothetical protein
MFQNALIICVLMGFIAWYYFNKFQESEGEYYRLHKRNIDLHSENRRLKMRVKDLHSYKNDVSRTFKILDNELLMINDHLKNNQRDQAQNEISYETEHGDGQGSQPSIFQRNNRVSILTPELLSSLFTNINQETTAESFQFQDIIESQQEEALGGNDQAILASVSYDISYAPQQDYTRYLINDDSTMQHGTCAADNGQSV